MKKHIYKLFFKILKTIHDRLQYDYTIDELFETTTGVKKFTHSVPIILQSDFAKTSSIVRTIPYDTYYLKTEKQKHLICADNHLIFNEHGETVCVKDVKINDFIKTRDGLERVVKNCSLGLKLNMYDLQIDSDDHMYYTNDILSHNTTITTAYLLWVAMFVPDQTILIVGNVLKTAIEILDRIKYSYEQLPDWLRDSSYEYNKTSIRFTNGSKIICRATTKSSANGLSVSILYCLSGDTTVTIRHKKTGQVETISLEDLHDKLQ